MRVVAIETSGRHGSLAALTGTVDEANLLRQIDLAGEQRTAQSLAPRLRMMLAEIGWPPQSIDLVAVSSGPGSFTGLRLGVTTAKVLAYATNAEIIAVNTLVVIATQVPSSPGPVWAILDAQRQELFAAKFTLCDRSRYQMDAPTRVVPQEAWLAELQPGERVTGPALRRLAVRLPPDIVVAAENMWQPTAAAVGRLAWQVYCDGKRDDVWKLTPVYYRPSAAEEKAAARTASGS
jgi:tRNA threonylcarbamoyladenosine biosynthesis protein TsaB